MDVAWALFWEKAGARNLMFFRGDERYLVCAAGADLSFWCVFVPALLLWLPAALAAFVCVCV